MSPRDEACLGKRPTEEQVIAVLRNVQAGVGG